MYNYIWSPNTMLSFRKTNEPIPRKLTEEWKDGWKDRRRNGRMEGQTNRPYFIRHFPLRPGVQQKIKLP